MRPRNRPVSGPLSYRVRGSASPVSAASRTVTASMRAGSRFRSTAWRPTSRVSPGTKALVETARTSCPAPPDGPLRIRSTPSGAPGTLRKDDNCGGGGGATTSSVTALDGRVRTTSPRANSSTAMLVIRSPGAAKEGRAPATSARSAARLRPGRRTERSVFQRIMGRPCKAGRGRGIPPDPSGPTPPRPRPHLSTTRTSTEVVAWGSRLASSIRITQSMVSAVHGLPVPSSMMTTGPVPGSGPSTRPL